MNLNTVTPESITTRDSVCTFSAQRHASIAKMKAILRAQRESSVVHHVLYNLLRGLNPRRGFTAPKNRGGSTNASFVSAAACARALAQRLEVTWEAEWSEMLSSSLRAAHLEDFDASCAQKEPAVTAALWEAMKLTPHGAHSNVLEHGRDCALQYQRICQTLRQGKVEAHWPQWLQEHGSSLLARQLAPATMRDYLVNHDCGKAKTFYRDEEGRAHFPEHAACSAEMWRQAGRASDEALLMELDMALHTLPTSAMEDFAKHRLSPSLLLATYAQLQSNAVSVFGGIESDSYKIKLKALNKRAKVLLSGWGLATTEAVAAS